MWQDSWSDVQLLVAINVCLVVLGGWIKGALIDPLDPGGKANSLWTNTYDVRPLFCTQCLTGTRVHAVMSPASDQHLYTRGPCSALVRYAHTLVC